MRLDKFLCDSLGVTRKEATQILKSKTVTVNDVMQKSGATKVTEECVVEWQGNELRVQGPRYIMVYKPEGFVCSHEDSSNRTVFDLLDEIKMDKLHFAGRLDVDTTGLVLVTDDGQWSHRITSPKHKCEKMYRVWLVDPVEDDYVEKFKEGIQLKSEDGLTLPAHLEVRAEREVLLTIHEGKYHQVKRMFAALGNKVEALHRERIGEIEMDESLELGEYRYLTQEEIDSIWK
ncbi:16S rRNA pseudouridine(516) synthase RsuA [Vibrio fortis]|jgi:16S rRNA pseudouridine516 synthase|uniref:Pseudouridine synthase n=1 Tax=Vibrio fortis TaxID=212667 RepID=A0A066UV08_9VIBR|nr:MULTISPECIES: 16S rRNA pseudouridine(516) synthase RsuA [Vibrio]KAB0303425.1 16S rRNA pseudouridine(516) synthase RsuA [Vibrio fortis]KDN27984.1 16S rRNA pseudouridylate synthase [Vibrio fortis]MDK9763492.1 16S rRNA pseudouridine(516) synthase RsuA [Vibrio sp. D420a]QFT10110.1 Ribosomal small subunit pseudouridine synthase A [Vibrio sp. THAF190c]|tara:strand:- start:89 stop:784 length:696 start_codon:yes stop_codon:yes gene_type:complete